MSNYEQLEIENAQVLLERNVAGVQELIDFWIVYGDSGCNYPYIEQYYPFNGYKDWMIGLDIQHSRKGS